VLRLGNCSCVALPPASMQSKEKYPKERRPVAAHILRSSLSPGIDERDSCPFVNVRHPCRTPSGLFPAKAPVLGAANGT